jgi:predicted DNA-binding transcriptional regulator YafY
VPRNAEVIRQWTILREIDATRGAGVTIDYLASQCEVTTRTIRRDLQALEEAGFPIYDDRSRDDGRTRWAMRGQVFKAMSTGLTLTELYALYFSRALFEAIVGTPLAAELTSAFEKLGAALTPHMRQFLDRLPQLIALKSAPNRSRPAAAGSSDRQIVGRLLEATLHHRQAMLTYHSRSSVRTKVYLIHPTRLAYAQGGLYLLAYVPEYAGTRTFALERIKNIKLLDERFTPPSAEPEGVAFPHSLGVHSGPPERIEIEFDASVAEYVRSREWHQSQRWRDRPGGRGLMTLDVCIDQALKSWVLAFGSAARVVAPPSFVRDVTTELEAARAKYGRNGAPGS